MSATEQAPTEKDVPVHNDLEAILAVANTDRDEALHAAFRRCGVLRVGSIDELFNVSDLLAKQPRPRGPRLTILTNAGGPGVLATDELFTSGGALAQLVLPVAAA